MQDLLVPYNASVSSIFHTWSSYSIPHHSGRLFLQVQVKSIPAWRRKISQWNFTGHIKHTQWQAHVQEQLTNTESVKLNVKLTTSISKSQFNCIAVQRHMLREKVNRVTSVMNLRIWSLKEIDFIFNYVYPGYT